MDRLILIARRLRRYLLLLASPAVANESFHPDAYDVDAFDSDAFSGLV